MKTGKRQFAVVQQLTRHLNCTQFGVYTRLMDYYCETEAPLPGDAALCSQIAGAASELERQAVDMVLALMFVKDGDRYRSAVADAEIADHQPRVKSAQANGSLGGRPKKTDPQPKPIRTGTQAKPSGLFVEGGEGEAPKQAAESSKATRLPKDWQLPKTWGEWALEDQPHWTTDIVRKVGEGFRDYWIAKPGKDGTKLDWLATWRTWCRGEITQRAYPPPRVNGYANGHAVNRQEAQEDRNRQVAARWLQSQEHS